MKTLIYGAGSLGTVLGAYLTRGGADVDLVSRNASHIAGLKAEGARITGTVGMTVPVKALLPGEMTGTYDLIFLLTKQTDNDAVVRGLTEHLAADGVVCTLQNGLPEPSIAAVVGEERTYGCAVGWGATLEGDGVVELTSDPESLTFSLGSFGGKRSPKLGEIARMLELMGPVEIEDNFIGARWAKLVVNCSFSGLSAVLGCTFGEVAENRTSRLFAQKIIKECIDAARGAGIVIEPIQGKDICRLLDYRSEFKRRISFAIIPLAIKKHRRLKASLLQDLEKGKKTEIDAINGIVCSYGRKHGVPTPVNDDVVRIVHGIEDGEYRSSFENLRLFGKIAEPAARGR